MHAGIQLVPARLRLRPRNDVVASVERVSGRGGTPVVAVVAAARQYLLHARLGSRHVQRVVVIARGSARLSDGVQAASRASGTHGRAALQLGGDILRRGFATSPARSGDGKRRRRLAVAVVRRPRLPRHAAAEQGGGLYRGRVGKRAVHLGPRRRAGQRQRARPPQGGAEEVQPRVAVLPAPARVQATASQRAGAARPAAPEVGRGRGSDPGHASEPADVVASGRSSVPGRRAGGELGHFVLVVADDGGAGQQRYLRRGPVAWHAAPPVGVPSGSGLQGERGTADGWREGRLAAAEHARAVCGGGEVRGRLDRRGVLRPRPGLLLLPLRPHRVAEDARPLDGAQAREARVLEQPLQRRRVRLALKPRLLPAHREL
mmetsp:Transcript_14270/g.54038  ORF Transcript_14270/g.54038 Transcript_14270/m.54038 type:complete len:375 (-) Transcript_14270:188-1312(-)